MFSLDELALGVCEKMRFQAEQKKHKLECIVSNKPAQVYADRDAIERVIINIVSNSIKYTPDGGIITVYVGSVNSNAYFKVVDNGIGIPAKDLDRIFERFYRVDKARSRKAGGTGLGLSIVKEMIEGNNGTIDIRSEVNKGTEVIVTLPTKIDTKNKGEYFMKYFDTHAHYNDKAFDENREEILNKCKAENVEYIVNVGASVIESLECIKLANTHDFIYSSIGIHPYNAKGDKVQDLYDMYKNEDNKKLLQ